MHWQSPITNDPFAEATEYLKHWEWFNCYIKIYVICCCQNLHYIFEVSLNFWTKLYYLNVKKIVPELLLIFWSFLDTANECDSIEKRRETKQNSLKKHNRVLKLQRYIKWIHSDLEWNWNWRIDKNFMKCISAPAFQQFSPVASLILVSFGCHGSRQCACFIINSICGLWQAHMMAIPGATQTHHEKTKVIHI